jgi:hypothetical protein
MASHGDRAETVDKDRWYTLRDAVPFLGGMVVEETLKRYCRENRVKAKQVGPRKQWHIFGAEIERLRQEWRLDT